MRSSWHFDVQHWHLLAILCLMMSLRCICSVAGPVLRVGSDFASSVYYGWKRVRECAFSMYCRAHHQVPVSSDTVAALIRYCSVTVIGAGDRSEIVDSGW